MLAKRPLAQTPFVRRDVAVSGPSSNVRETRSASWGIAVEAPIEIALNGVPWTVLLATPADIENLAVGVALTERILRDVRAVSEVQISEFLHDVSVNIVVPAEQLDTTRLRSRSLVSSTACGLCGLESLAELARQMKVRSPRGAASDASVPSATMPERDIPDAALQAAFASLASQQPLNRETRSVHAAAWCAPDGTIQLVREDVGRHNALDKLVGAMAERGLLASDGFVVMTSRCSYELVYKAALTNARMLATISAPTTMALEWARALGLPLASTAGVHIVRFPDGDIDAG